jgi:hypothetical protein
VSGLPPGSAQVILPNSPGSTAAIVTTLRNAGAVLDSFVSYHRAIGFSHVFLFFDDPADPDLARASAMTDVTAIAHDAALRNSWQTLPSYPIYRTSLDSEVMSRQLLNVEHAMRLARRRGHDWLLNIDSDELFFSPDENVAEHFAQLTATPAECVSYLNYEAIPESDEIGDYFREVDLFKLPFGAVRVHLPSVMGRAEQSVPQLRPFFHFYTNGKSAVRLSVDGLSTAGVHAFRRLKGRLASVESKRQFILHYPCCGFDAFWTKYVTLGRFADKWWGAFDIAQAIGSFHLEARDVIAQGGREAALAFYRERLAISDRRQAEQLIGLGLVTRLALPRQIIMAGAQTS